MGQIVNKKKKACLQNLKKNFFQHDYTCYFAIKQCFWLFIKGYINWFLQEFSLVVVFMWVPLEKEENPAVTSILLLIILFFSIFDENQ